jgi:hypothetical protein
VSASASCIRVGECFQLSMQSVDAWSGTLPAFNADLHRLAANLFTVKSRLGRLGKAGGMVPDPLHAGGWAGEVSALLGRTAALLRWSLSRGDCDAAVRHARSLLGLGPGLTPSGDDFLVGLFAVLNVARSPAPEWRSLGKHTLDGADALTNAISLAALREAADGRVRESMVELLRQMMLGTSAGIAAPMARVLAIGSTSGADIVAGMVSGIELLLERAQRVTMTNNTHAAGTLCLELQLNLERKHAGDPLP